MAAKRKPARARTDERTRDPQERVNKAKRDLLLAGAELAAFGERYEFKTLALAGRVVEALHRVVSERNSQTDRQLARAADTLLSALPKERRSLVVPRPGDKAPIAETVRADVSRGLDEGRSAAELAVVVQVRVAMTLGSERIFGAPRRNQDRAALWTPVIVKVLDEKSGTRSALAAEIVKACARASGYRGRLSDLFPDG